MRPAVHASILRTNRSQRTRRVLRPHSFSMRRLLLLAFIGSLFFIPGIVLTIVGLEKTTEEMDSMTSGKRIMYQAVGPALASLGVAFLFSACVYYYCYGTGDPARVPGGAHQKSFHSSTNSDHDHHHHGHHGHHHGHHHHHHKGHHDHLDTPDGEGGRRKLSFKEEENHTPRPSPRHRGAREEEEGEEDEEQVPLAAASQHRDLHSPPLSAVAATAIRLGGCQAPEVDDDTEAQERELLVNGEIPYADEAPV
ncbi:hypothetical protein ACOMHN_041224 [Nucella lapillus]